MAIVIALFGVSCCFFSDFKWACANKGFLRFPAKKNWFMPKFSRLRGKLNLQTHCIRCSLPRFCLSSFAHSRFRSSINFGTNKLFFGEDKHPLCHCICVHVKLLSEMWDILTCLAEILIMIMAAEMPYERGDSLFCALSRVRFWQHK